MTPAGRVGQESGAGWRRISVTLMAGILLKQIPWAGWGLAVRPDFLLIALLFWALHRPSRVSMGLAFALGLLSDFQDGVVFGQHALAYAVAVYVIQYFRLRLLQFDAARQSLQALPIFLLAQLILLVVGWLSGQPPKSLNILLPALSGTLLWYFVALVLHVWYGKEALRRA
jgi:rod shape-determining protein MreD